MGRPKKVLEEVSEYDIPKEQALAVNIAPGDTMRYHDTEEPRLFKAGEEIAEGWQEGRVFGDMVWKPSLEPDAKKSYWKKVKM